MSEAVSESAAPVESSHDVLFKPLGIDTWREHVVYLHRDCAVCHAEGFTAQTRVTVTIGTRSLVATLNLVGSALLSPLQVSLSTGACNILQAREGDIVRVSHGPTLDSLRGVRAKAYGHHLDRAQLCAIMQDVAAGRYADVHIAAFLTACVHGKMNLRETVDLTRAMVETGETLRWDRAIIADKHCVGGLPGNRTTPIVVAIAAASGLMIPKTSSRAITSPAGTADMMEVLTPVALSAGRVREVVAATGASLVWGGALSLSPADDVLIQVARALELDSDAQMVASILSKKIAAGATHVLIDVPVGPSAKIRQEADLNRLRKLMTHVAAACGIRVLVVRTDGTQPVGRGIGPALEARDVLEVLQCKPGAPQDLRARSVMLAGLLLEFCESCPEGAGPALAVRALDSGAAWRKFEAICEAQGGLRAPGEAVFRQDMTSPNDGIVTEIDCRLLARTARLAGAPERQVAGIDMNVRLGDAVRRGDTLYTLHAQASGELAYAAAYATSHPAIRIGEPR